jgi:hypothetical protein
MGYICSSFGWSLLVVEVFGELGRGIEEEQI